MKPYDQRKHELVKSIEMDCWNFTAQTLTPAQHKILEHIEANPVKPARVKHKLTGRYASVKQ